MAFLRLHGSGRIVKSTGCHEAHASHALFSMFIFIHKNTIAPTHSIHKTPSIVVCTTLPGSCVVYRGRSSPTLLVGNSRRNTYIRFPMLWYQLLSFPPQHWIRFWFLKGLIYFWIKLSFQVLLFTIDKFDDLFPTFVGMVGLFFIITVCHPKLLYVDTFCGLQSKPCMCHWHSGGLCVSFHVAIACMAVGWSSMYEEEEEDTGNGFSSAPVVWAGPQ